MALCDWQPCEPENHSCTWPGDR